MFVYLFVLLVLFYCDIVIYSQNVFCFILFILFTLKKKKGISQGCHLCVKEILDETLVVISLFFSLSFSLSLSLSLCFVYLSLGGGMIKRE